MFNSKLLVDFIKKNNLSKTQFCKECGITLYALNKLLGPHADKTRIPVILKVACYTNIKVDDFTMRSK